MTGAPLVQRTWTSRQFGSRESFTLRASDEGFRLEGAVTITGASDALIDLRYSVDVDARWQTRSAVVRSPAGPEMVITRDTAGSWVVGASDDPRLDDCTDIDLGWTPSTNTLPIMRCGLQQLESMSTRAAWLRWPDLHIQPIEQHYTRLDDRLWRYRSGTFEALLTVDQHAVVERYTGDLIWSPE